MAITHSTTIRNGIADLVVDAIDVSGPGSLVFLTSGDAPVATCTFSNPAFGSATGGTATANAISSDTNAAGGTMAKFEIRDGTPTMILTGNVQTSGGDINASSLTVGNGDTVAVTSLTYTASP